jgi:hypothetical protein
MRLIIFLRRINKMTKKEERKAYDKLGEILTDALNNLIAEEKKESKGTTCQNCGEPTGYGRGSEPTRYDTLVCSTKCAKILYNY